MKNFILTNKNGKISTQIENIIFKNDKDRIDYFFNGRELTTKETEFIVNYIEKEELDIEKTDDYNKVLEHFQNNYFDLSDNLNWINSNYYLDIETKIDRIVDYFRDVEFDKMTELCEDFLKYIETDIRTETKHIKEDFEECLYLSEKNKIGYVYYLCVNRNDKNINLYYRDEDNIVFRSDWDEKIISQGYINIEDPDIDEILNEIIRLTKKEVLKWQL